MATQSRIYAVADKAGKVRLVEASHPSHALRHVASDTFTVKVPTQRELVDLMKKQTTIEIVKPEQGELPTT